VHQTRDEVACQPLVQVGAALCLLLPAQHEVESAQESVCIVGPVDCAVEFVRHFCIDGRQVLQIRLKLKSACILKFGFIFKFVSERLITLIVIVEVLKVDLLKFVHDIKLNRVE